MTLPPLKEVIELTEFADKVYRYLKPQEYIGTLAPSLGMIIEKDLGLSHIVVGEEYLDPKIFLAMTYFREPLVEALKAVNTSLQSLSDAVPVIPLTQAMGLGKTHFLTLLYHLYTKVPIVWQSIGEYTPDQAKILVQKANYKIDIAKKAVIIALDLKHTPIGTHNIYQALFLITRRILESYKVQNLINELPDRSKLTAFIEFLSKAHEYDPKDAARKFMEHLSNLAITIPVLILIDELYAAVFEAIQAESKEAIESLRRTLMFLISLIDELRGRVPAVLVYASAMQDVLRWNNFVKNLERLKSSDEIKSSAYLLKEAIGYFEDRVRRFTPVSIKDVNEEEALGIVKRRVLRFKISEEKISEYFDTSKLKDALTKIVGEGEAEMFISDVKKSYPFSPTYKELVKKLINPSYNADLASEKLQHLRDLIKISSVIIARVLEKTDDKLISIAHVEHDDLKHLLDEGYANEWRRIVSSCKDYARYIESEEKDPTLGKILRGIISSIYVKSVTNNAWTIIEMLRNPETLTAEELEKRSIHQRRLVISLIGLIEPEELGKIHNAFTKIESAPYIQSIDRSDGKYYLLSFFTNPYQLLKNIQEEEVRKLKDSDGKLDLKMAIEYLRQNFEEFALISELKSSKVTLAMEFALLENFYGYKPEFLQYLRNNEFTILVISPINVAEEILIKKRSKFEILDDIANILENNRNNIQALNMFAIVVPFIDENTLGRLIQSLSEIKASKVIVDMLKSDEGKRKLADKVEKTHRTLLDIMDIRSEEYFRQIVIEILEKFRERLEDYAQQLNNVAVQNFTSDFIGMFRHVITYDPKTNSIATYNVSINVQEQPQEISKIFASFPVWLIATLKGQLNIADAPNIRAKLTEWLKNEAIKSKSRLIKGEILIFNIPSILECFKRGWSEIPIKPASINDVKLAINSLKGELVVDDPELKLIQISVTDNDITIKLKKEVITPPKPKPRPSELIKKFTVSDSDSVIIVLSSISSISQNIKAINLDLRAFDIKRKVESVQIEIKGEYDKIKTLTEPIIRFINRYKNDLTLCELTLEFIEPIKKPDAEAIINKLGLKLSKVRFS